jgi:hypothetical protein
MNYVTPRVCQGQIVTRSYRCDEAGIYRRTFDASDRTETVDFIEWSEDLDAWFDRAGGFQDEEPPVEEALWESR